MMRRAFFLATVSTLLVSVAGQLQAQTPAQRAAVPGPRLAPAAFTPPIEGTTYHYDTFANKIVGTDGMTTTYVDVRGGLGRRLGVFFNDNPKEPLQYVSDSLAMLWPLTVGKRSRFSVRRGELMWTYEARVTDTERVTVPSGTYDTYVITTIETPLRTRAPAFARTRVTTFWYAPAVNNVVRLMSLSTAANGTRDTRRAQLVRVEAPAQAKR